MADPFEAWAELAISMGWTYDTTTAGHPRLTPPPGTIDPRTGRLAKPAIFGKTVSDRRRGDANTVSYLRQMGVEIPHRNPKKKKKDK